MNISALYSLYLLYSQSLLVTDGMNTEVANSLRYVIDYYYFNKRSSSFVFVISCPRLKTWYYFSDIMEELFNRGEAIKVQIVVNDTSAEHIAPGERNFNLIFVDSGESFLNIDPASKVKDYDVNEYYFVFIQNQDKFLPGDIQKILDYCWKHYIINVDILIQKASGELVIYTYFPFTSSHCRKVVPVQVNQFRNGRMDNENIFPAKLLNMHDCPVKVAMRDLPPFLSVDVQKAGRDAIGGFEGELLKTLSAVMNFRIHYNILPDIKLGIISTNGSTSTNEMVQSREADMAIGFFHFTKARARILTATDTYYQTRKVFVVLQESPNYITPEMIFYPFPPNIWILLIITFVLVLGIQYAIITWARWKSLEVSRVTLKNLWMDFFAMNLGMPTVLNPKQYFVRLFITTWMLYTLVLRVQYQSLLYHLIRHNFFERPPNSLDEVIQQGYTFIMNQRTYITLQASPLFQDSNLQIKSISNIDLGVVYSYMTDHLDEKLVALEPNEFFLYFGAKNHKPGVFVSLGDTMLVDSICIYLTKHSFLVKRINDLIRSMSAYGLMTSWVSKVLHLSHFMVPTEAKQATIGQNELKLAFCLCGILLGLSAIVFILELLSLRFRILKKVLDKL